MIYSRCLPALLSLCLLLGFADLATEPCPADMTACGYESEAEAKPSNGSATPFFPALDLDLVVTAALNPALDNRVGCEPLRAEAGIVRPAWLTNPNLSTVLMHFAHRIK